MSWGAADAGLGRSPSSFGVFVGALVGDAGAVAVGLGASDSDATAEVGVLEDFVDGVLLVVDGGGTTVRAALTGGVDAAPACRADVDVGAGVTPVGEVALATFVVGHRPP